MACDWDTRRFTLTYKHPLRTILEMSLEVKALQPEFTI